MGFFFRINLFKGAGVGGTLLIHSDRTLILTTKCVNPSLFSLQRHTISDYYKPRTFSDKEALN
jgi:hypothetical protein